MRLRQVLFVTILAALVLFSVSCHKEKKVGGNTVVIQLSVTPQGSCQQAQPGSAPMPSIGINQGDQIEYETPNSVPFDVQFPEGGSPCPTSDFRSASGSPVYTGVCQGSAGNYPYSQITINNQQCTLVPGMGAHIPR